jgi:hypothetical protein
MQAEVYAPVLQFQCVGETCRGLECIPSPSLWLPKYASFWHVPWTPSMMPRFS